jgi:hypothetical protein
VKESRAVTAEELLTLIRRYAATREAVHMSHSDAAANRRAQEARDIYAEIVKAIVENWDPVPECTCPGITDESDCPRHGMS